MTMADALDTPKGWTSMAAEKRGGIAMMWGYNTTGMNWWMALSSIVWLGLIAVAVWAFARWASRPPQQATWNPTPAPPATEILRQRFARGELDSDTFERMRQQLEAAPTDQRTPANVS